MLAWSRDWVLSAYISRDMHTLDKFLYINARWRGRSNDWSTPPLSTDHEIMTGCPRVNVCIRNIWFVLYDMSWFQVAILQLLGTTRSCSSEQRQNNNRKGVPTWLSGRGLRVKPLQHKLISHKLLPLASRRPAIQAAV